MVSKEEYYNFFIEKGKGYPILSEKGIQKYNSDLYSDIITFKNEYYLNSNMKFSELLYCYLKDIFTIPICLVCNISTVKFKQFSFGYFESCSVKCSSNSLLKKQKIMDTCLDRYGHINIAHGILSEKIKQKNIEKYGYEYPAKNENVKDRIIKTNIDRYGVKYTFLSDSIKEKIKISNILRYGYEYAIKSDMIRSKLVKYPSKDIKDYLSYKRSVRYYSEKVYRDNIENLNPFRYKRSNIDYQLDHIYPIKEGWLKNVDPIDISNVNNLRIITSKENKIKNCKTDLSVDEFYNMIKKI